MSLFNFWKKTNPDSPAHEAWIAAKRLYNEGNYEQCLYALSSGFKKDINYSPLYRLAADTAARLGAPDAQELFAAVSNNPNDADAFDQLGNMYFGNNDFELTIAFLQKAVELNPGNNGAWYDLALCYARLSHINAAIDVLQKAPSPDFWNKYLLNKLKIFNRDTEGVRESIKALEEVLAVDSEDGEAGVKLLKIEELQEMILRFSAMPETHPHIRHWQFIQYGGVVLDCYEGQDDFTGGRYALASGSYGSVRALLDKLKQFTGEIPVDVQGVAALPDRDSEIIGRALAKILGVGFGTYDCENAAGNQLIIAARTSLFDDYYELNTISNGQLLFAACHNWLEGAYVCPDIIGFMAQSYVFPWEGGSVKVIDMENDLCELLERDDRPVEAIAETICSSKAVQEDASEWLAFYAGQKAYIKGIGHLAGTNRYNFMVESPVPGSFFL